MKKQTVMDRNIIELLLSSLKLSQTGEGNIARQHGNCPFLDADPPVNIQDAQTSYYLREFADEMPGGFFIYRADGDEEIIYANKAMLWIFNCESMEEFRELTGNSFRGIVHPDDLEAVERSIKEQIQESKYDLDYVEYRIIQKGGHIRWIDDYGHFVRSETAGDIFYVFVGDTTEEKKRLREEKEMLLYDNFQKEQQLQNWIEEHNQKLQVINQEQLRRLEVIEGLSVDYESIFYVDLDMNQIRAYRVSQRFEQQFPKDHLIREFTGFDTDYIRTWVYPDDRELISGITKPENIRKKLSVEKSFHVNFRILKEGKPAYIQLRMVNVGKEEHVSQIVIGYRNVDDEIIQEMTQKQMLTDALDEANKANNAKNLFLSNMSHDIRTPMNAIVSLTSLVKKHIGDRARVLGYLDMISASSDQLLQLLNDVLEISRIESGKIQIEEKECSLLEMAHQIQMSMIPRAAAKNITLSLDISNLKHDAVCTDQEKLGQILSYLVDNAVKYTKKGGRITFTVIEQDAVRHDFATYEFIVEDNGVGISEKFLKHIFEPFEREKNTTFSGIHGTGLGLSIAKALVWMLGGTIEVFSVVGEGSKFTVALPLRILEPQPEQAEEIGDALPGVSEPKRILVVDDNEINREIEYEVLRDVGFLVETAADGSIAVEKVNRSSPGYYDLILMDIQMPIMDGYHAARSIRKIENPALAGIPIIAVSANTFEEDKRMAMESGMNAHLGKPLDTARLYQLIWKLLKDKVK